MAQFYWHVHHDVLVEIPTAPIEERIKSIQEDKPKDEVKLRLRLLKPVHGKLPETFAQAREAYFKAGETFIKTRIAYDEAWEASKKDIEALHAQECLDCPWDGFTIFPNK